MENMNIFKVGLVCSTSTEDIALSAKEIPVGVSVALKFGQEATVRLRKIRKKQKAQPRQLRTLTKPGDIMQSV